ncbi:MAG: hypothetical protein HQ504_00850 [Rhodospirillaceae bacterium]|nr:hypothetical protein [Rhodospirillaceae bacterium]
MDTLSFSQAMVLALADTGKPVISDFDLSIIIAELLTYKMYNSTRISVRQGDIDQESFTRRIRTIEKNRIVIPDEDFSRGRPSPKIRYGANVWWISGAPKGTAEDVACITDPFCHISYLSAMQRYGLTERAPKNLILGTYKRDAWNSQRDKLEETILEKINADGLALRKISMPSKIRGRKIEIHEFGQPRKTIDVVDTFARVSEIGTTFVDMLERPELCGGMEHILTIWENESEKYLDQIIRSVDQTPRKITKVRAGYILDERMGLNDTRVMKWQTYATRGGDQKLDPHGDFRPPYSDKWMISING